MRCAAVCEHHGRQGETIWHGHDIRVRYIPLATPTSGSATLNDPDERGGGSICSAFRTGIEVSSNPNDREPVNGVNTSRMDRHSHRNCSDPHASNGIRHTVKWLACTALDPVRKRCADGADTRSTLPQRPWHTGLPARHHSSPPASADGSTRASHPTDGIPKVSYADRKFLPRGVLTIHGHHLNHPCLRNQPQFEISSRIGLGQSVLHDRSTTSRTTDPRSTAPAPPRFVPVRFAPAHPGSSHSWRDTRRRVTVPRLSRDGVLHACVETPPPAVRHPTAGRVRRVPVGIVLVP